MKALLFLWLTVSVLLVLPLPFCGTGRSPRCFKRRLGGRIQFTLHFTYVIYRISWITATLSGLLLPQVPFYLSAGFAFSYLSAFFNLFFVSVVIFYFYMVIACFPFGTYVFSLGLACVWVGHMTDHGLGLFPSSTVHCRTWTSRDQLGHFGLLWHT